MTMKLSYLYDAYNAMEKVKAQQLEKDAHDYNPEYNKAIEMIKSVIEEIEKSPTIYVSIAVENDYKRPKIWEPEEGSPTK